MPELRHDPDRAFELLETETAADRARIWRRFRPETFPTVVGVFEPRRSDPETGMPESQHWKTMCLVCGDRFRGSCSTGAVRTHVCRFGAVHAHRDPLKEARKT